MEQCLICFDQTPFMLELPCGCRLCHDCFFNWCKSYCEDNIYSSDLRLPCPFEYCRSPIPPSAFVPLLGPRRAGEINALLLQNYITQHRDVKRCPRPGCNFAGVAGALPEGCECYICNKCGQSWLDEESGSLGEAMRWVRELRTRKNELLSNLAKIVIGNYCPNCSVHIEKDGGCSHVVCSKCKHEFCWYCLDSYYGYRHEGTRPCGLRMLYLIFICFFAAFPAFSKLVQSVPSATTLLPYLSYVVKYVPLALIEVVGALGIPAGYFVAVCEVRSKGWRKSCSAWLCYTLLFVFLHLVFALYNYLLYIYGTMWTVWSLIFTAGTTYFSGVLAAAIVGHIVDKARENKLDQLIAFTILLLCEVAAGFMFFFEYYPLIILLCLINMELAAVLIVAINACKTLRTRLDYQRDKVKALFHLRVAVVLTLTVATGYNALLAWLRLFAVFRLMAYTALLICMLFFEFSARAQGVRMVGLAGSTIVAVYIYCRNLA